MRCDLEGEGEARHQPLACVINGLLNSSRTHNRSTIVPCCRSRRWSRYGQARASMTAKTDTGFHRSLPIAAGEVTMKALIKLGKERNYVTYSDLNQVSA